MPSIRNSSKVWFCSINPIRKLDRYKIFYKGTKMTSNQTCICWPRVVDLVLLGVETWVKNVPNRTKIVQGNKNVLLWHIMVQNWCACLLWPCMALCSHVIMNDLMWPCMALCGLIWPYVMWSYFCFSRPWQCVALLELAWPCVSWCGLVWPWMTLYVRVWPFYGLKWPFMVIYGRISSFHAVIEPN